MMKIKLRQFLFFCGLMTFISSTSALASGPCTNECRIRASVGNRLVKGDVSNQAMDLMAQLNRDNIKTCRDTCISETTPAGCEACAKKTISKDKRVQDRNQLAQFDCPTGSQCVEVQQPVFNYTTVPPAPGQIMKGPGKICAEECKNRLPYGGMKVDAGKIEEAKKVAQETGLQVVTECISQCSQIPDTDCNACAAEKITEEARQQMTSQIMEQFECVEKEQSVGQAVFEGIIGGPGTFCGLLENIQVNISQVK